MAIDRYSYMRCPECDTHKGGHQTKLPKHMGGFTIKMIGDIAIFQCQRCLRVHKRRVSAPLTYADMTPLEKNVFPVSKQRAYNTTQKNCKEVEWKQKNTKKKQAS